MIIDYTRIQRTARHISSRLPPWSAVDANDLAQEAVLYALKGRESFNGPMLDLLRRQGWISSHRSSNIQHQRVGLKESCSKTSPEPQWSASIDIYALLSHLAPKQRQAVSLHHLSGMTETEMSVLLGVNVPTLRNRIYEGMKSMRRLVMA